MSASGVIVNPYVHLKTELWGHLQDNRQITPLTLFKCNVIIMKTSDCTLYTQKMNKVNVGNMFKRLGKIGINSLFNREKNLWRTCWHTWKPNNVSTDIIYYIYIYIYIHTIIVLFYILYPSCLERSIRLTFQLTTVYYNYEPFYKLTFQHLTNG